MKTWSIIGILALLLATVPAGQAARLVPDVKTEGIGASPGGECGGVVDYNCDILIGDGTRGCPVYVHLGGEGNWCISII